MPYFDADDPAAWAAAYNPPYERANMARILGSQPLRILGHLRGYGLQNADAILIVGGGFGWIAEQWMAAGCSNIIITDTSAWIQARLGANAVLAILNNPLSTAPQRNAIKAALGGAWPKWVITEDALPCLLDSEISSLIGTANAIVDSKAGGGVVHLVSRVRPGDSTPPMTMNWRPLDQWATYIAGAKGSNSPRHIIVSMNHVIESVEVP